MPAAVTGFTCSKCRRAISQPKYARKLQGKILCVNCFANATAPEPIAMLTPLDIAEPLPYAKPVPNVQPKNLKGDFMICPNCGYKGLSERRAKASLWLATILFLFGGIPGIIYCLLRAGYRFYCPSCGIKVGSVWQP